MVSYTHKSQQRFFVDNLMNSIKLADISTRSSNRPLSIEKLYCPLIKGMHAGLTVSCIDTLQLSQLIKVGIVRQRTAMSLQHVYCEATVLCMRFYSFGNNT